MCAMGGSLGAANTSPVPPVQGVLCYGDSLTAGYLTPSTFHPYSRSLEDSLGTVAVRAVGASGRLAINLAEEVNRPHDAKKPLLDVCLQEWQGLRAALRAAPTSLCIIMAGTNDVGHGREASEILAALITLHEAAWADGVDTIAVTIPQSHTSVALVTSHGQTNALLREWGETQLERSCAVEHGSSQVGRLRAVVDSCELLPHVMPGSHWGDDGLHMKKAGYIKFGKLLAPFVRDALSQQPVTVPSPDGAASLPPGQVTVEVMQGAPSADGVSTSSPPPFPLNYEQLEKLKTSSCVVEEHESAAKKALWVRSLGLVDLRGEEECTLIRQVLQKSNVRLLIWQMFGLSLEVELPVTVAARLRLATRPNERMTTFAAELSNMLNGTRNTNTRSTRFSGVSTSPVWLTSRIPKHQEECVELTVPDGCVVTGFNVASLFGESFQQLRIVEVKVDGSIGAELFDWSPCGSLDLSPSDYDYSRTLWDEASCYTPGLITVATSATRFKVSVRQTADLQAFAGLAIFRAVGIAAPRTEDEILAWGANIDAIRSEGATRYRAAVPVRHSLRICADCCDTDNHRYAHWCQYAQLCAAGTCCERLSIDTLIMCYEGPAGDKRTYCDGCYWENKLYHDDCFQDNHDDPDWCQRVAEKEIEEQAVRAGLPTALAEEVTTSIMGFLFQ